MKRSILSILLSSITFLQVYGQIPVSAVDTSQKEYKNSIYRFSVRIPNAWKLYGQILNDSINNKAIVDWGLPLVHSELEDADIENSISITAYRREEIHSIDELISAERLRIDRFNTAFEADTINANARIVFSTINGLKYKGKSYFEFKNNIGYVINFTATPGTFDKNLTVFEKFYLNIRFQ